MQINSIQICNLLSFEAFAWDDLDPRLNVVVGPNGVGKTNLFRALQLVHDVLNPKQAQTSMHWDTVGHQGVNADDIIIALDIQFTTEWEKRLLCVFLASVLCNQQEIQQTIQQENSKAKAGHQRFTTPEGLKIFDAWILNHVRPEDIAWFLHGRLVLTHAGRVGWQCQYESPAFRLDLIGSSTFLGHAEHEPGTNSGSLFAAWYNSLDPHSRLLLRMALASKSDTFLKHDFGDWSLPDWVSSQQGVALQVEDHMQVVDPTMLATRQVLTSVARISSLEPGRVIGSRIIFQQLLEQALVFTDNVRLPYQREFAARDLYTQSFDLSNGKELARFLFYKKNSGPKDRQQYDAIKEMFSQITGRQFAVVPRPIESYAPSQTPDMILELVTINSWGDIPLEFSGAGISEALFLSVVLAGSSGQVVLLDEPALNLHPTMQTTLLGVLQAIAHQPESTRSQFLVNTHTPSLVPPDAIEHVSRLTLQNGHTIRQALQISQIIQSELVKLRNLLRGNLAARALLFSRAILLVEGETELGPLPIWFPELMSQDIASYAVGGRGAFVSPLKLIHNFAIPWAIIGDGEVLWDLSEKKSLQGPQGQIGRILTACGRSLPSFPGDPGSNASDFKQWQQTLETDGIFTSASGADEGFEKAIQTEIPPKLWTHANTEFGANKVARGRFIAENCPCPTKVKEIIRRVLCHLQKQDASITIPSRGYS